MSHKARENTNLEKGVDIKTASGYAVAPGSKIGGGFYKVVEDKPIAQMSFEVWKHIFDKTKTVSKPNGRKRPLEKRKC